MPICPSAQTDSYTAGYQVTPAFDNFTVSCNGRSHAGLGLGLKPNEPFYNPTSGLGPRVGETQRFLGLFDYPGLRFQHLSGLMEIGVGGADL